MPSTTSRIPFEKRTSTHPLSAYLLRLMVVKRSNLCLSADVTSVKALLQLAATIGPSIVVLKTHFDIVADWDSNPRTGTGARLASLAREHGFLIFEDRKFSDIGSTVQKQYTEGPGKIVEWAHITNAHVLPGPSIVASLQEAADKWRERTKYDVRTNITVGTPRPESLSGDEECEREALEHESRAAQAGRKASIVSITTVSQHFEPANTPRKDRTTDDVYEEDFTGIEEAPLERGLLLLAQMSSANNLLDAKYTKACVEIARNNKGFVMGYIAQESLNSSSGDQFLSMTPGCQLPPDDEDEVKGDGKGQQYNTPQKLVGTLGTDIVIVGRGIIKSADPINEAEKYRTQAWEAYEKRIRSSASN